MPQLDIPRSNARKLAAKPARSKLETTALDAAFDALKTYDLGASRAALLPIDEAVTACLDDKAVRSELEQRLMEALNSRSSVAAREYLCSKLTLIGSDLCVPALAALLNTPELATAARNVLEAIPGPKATRALRSSLPNAGGLQKVGIIHSLGSRRDADSVGVLTRLLNHTDTTVAGAAAAALGDIGSAKAAKALRDFQPGTTETVRPIIADAILTCAERLLAAGKRTDAQALYQTLTPDTQPKHVQRAAARGLELASGKK